jgi:peptidoglycan/xylan/chitin deacetylase (PgdA/CDA1 family)
MRRDIRYLFPGGKPKALVMSYDDGSEHDRRLVDIFNRYGIRASFHLNSEKLGRAHHVRPGEVRSLYRGHEVSCHSVSHPDLTRLSDDAVRWEIGRDRQVLEQLTGGPVRGLAYPFGAYDRRVMALLPELGIEYARTVNARDDFGISENFLAWETSGHHSAAMELGERFLEADRRELQLLHIWGHSYELDGFMTADPSKDWRYIEDFCRLMQGNGSIFYATTIEAVDYLNALGKLEISQARIINRSSMPLWIRWNETVLEIEPGRSSGMR